MSDLRILTWFWRQEGGRATYTAMHVNIWADMVRRNLKRPARIACVTDSPEGIDPRVEIIPPPRDFEDWRIPSWGPSRPQCLRRIAMFSPAAGDIFGERFICMDMDCVVTGGLDPLFDAQDDFRIYRGTAAGRPYNGSMMLLAAGARAQVYERFTLQGAIDAGRKFIGSDQAWISHCLGPNEATWGPEHGVMFYGERGRGQGIVTFFPGSTKPWAVKDDWVRRNYRRSGRGRVLILGYAPSVWRDAEVALSSGSFDGVIASPEAAAHWPSALTAVANTDEEADRLAELHGFDDVVWCGRTDAEAA